ncbi:MAG: hypothetical protein JXA54_11690 [Candidatus Heimdallarchaeota archaeon]|nr:hypothetical protein [Candidatus Heimdallarchaeota archaeon]
MDSQMIVDLRKEKSLLMIKVRLILLGNLRILRPLRNALTRTISVRKEVYLWY